ncbi:hypothetical protein BN2475_50032 [Paraburkholderia ribeironis]|uniref:Uncharacterized protein n=1 Tax=Paraburkholderia ribeironis TaxID=1247936 RepID=A0A1N7RK02_9BURK|nr:hypothetical protein BN2475_50032 [Paraburkholderia ribeironis]
MPFREGESDDSPFFHAWFALNCTRRHSRSTFDEKLTVMGWHPCAIVGYRWFQIPLAAIMLTSNEERHP